MSDIIPYYNIHLGHGFVEKYCLYISNDQTSVIFMTQEKNKKTNIHGLFSFLILTTPCLLKGHTFLDQ